MDSVRYDAFWSYAHEDNSRQSGRVLGLAAALQDEFSVVTGDELELFIDRDSVGWGDLWRERIDQALGEAPFFIALVTPKYVRSVECRKELLAFSREAKSRGIAQLLLPILFIDVDGLDENNEDEVLAILARTQYVDWTSLRLRQANDPLVLAAVNSLVNQIRALRSEVTETERVQGSRSDAETYESITEVFELISEKLRTWMESVEFDHIAGSLWSATLIERLDRVDRLRASKQPTSARLSVFKRLGEELQPIARDRLEKAQAYSRLTIDLDPLVTAAMRFVSEYPDLSSLLDPVRDGVAEAVLNIEPSETREGYGYTMPPEIKKFSRGLLEADRYILSSVVFVNEANEIVLRWRDELMGRPNDHEVEATVP